MFDDEVDVRLIDEKTIEGAEKYKGILCGVVDEEITTGVLEDAGRMKVKA